MMFRTLMLSVATSALALSPALAQDDQTSGETGQTETVTVPLDTEATVTITEEIEVPIEGEVTIDVDVTAVEADPAVGSGEEGAREEGLSVAEDEQQPSGDMAEQGLAAGDDETGDQGTEGGASGSGMAEGDSQAAQEDSGVAAAEDAAQDGPSIEDEGGTGVASGEGRTTEGGEPVEGRFVTGEQIEDDSIATDETQAGAETGETGPTAEEQATADYGRLAEMTVDDILSMPVESTDQRRVGDIDYLIQREGRIEAVIGVGGFLGLNEYTVALPLEDFRLVDGGDRLFVEYTEDELTAMPELDESGLQGLDGTMRITDIAGRG